MCIINYYKDGNLVPSSTNKGFNASHWKAMDEVGSKVNTPGDRARITENMRLLDQENTTLYNDMVINTLQHAKTMDALDFVELSDYPEFIAMKEQLMKDFPKETPDKIAEVSRIFGENERALRSDIRNANGSINNLSWFATRDLIKSNQAVQAVGSVRGYLPDVNKEIVPYCIPTCLADGMNNVSSYAVLSRESIVSAAASKKDLATVATQGRRMSYVAMYKQQVIETDCGSTEYVLTTIKPNLYSKSGDLISATNLNDYVGIFYKETPDPNEPLKQLTAKDTHLLGKTIHRRSQFTCALPNTHHVCSTCYGEASRSLPVYDNVGIVITKSFGSSSIQMTLSYKHSIGQQSGKSNGLSPALRKFFNLKNSAYQKAKVKGVVKFTIAIPTVDMVGMSSIALVKDVRTLSTSRISSINTIIPIIEKKQSVIADGPITIAQDGNNASLSYEALSYIKQHPESIVTTGGNYIFDITDFPDDTPIFTKPLKFLDASTVFAGLIKLMEFSPSAGMTLNKYCIMDTLSHIMDMVPGTSISTIELLLSSYLSDQKTKLGSRLMDGVHSPAGTTIFGRSLSTAFLYQSQTRLLSSCAMTLPKQRADSPLDVIIDPVGVLKHQGVIPT